LKIGKIGLDLYVSMYIFIITSFCKQYYLSTHGMSELAGGIYHYLNHFPASITRIKYHCIQNKQKHLRYIKIYGMGFCLDISRKQFWSKLRWLWIESGVNWNLDSQYFVASDRFVCYLFSLRKKRQTTSQFSTPMFRVFNKLKSLSMKWP